MSTALDQLRQLTAAEKLHIVEALWDDIGASGEPIVLRDWHRKEDERRGAELEIDPGVAITREELWKHVDGSDA